MPLIELRNITKRYPNTPLHAVSNISFSVEKGEVLALLGPSGSGKTTLLRLIAGFESPDSGGVLLGDALMNSPEGFVPTENRRVGMVFQDGGLFPHLTVDANIAFGLYRYKKSERDKKVSEMLSLVSLEGFGSRYPHELSGGQQQRVALARALAPNPVVLLMDEPFSNLDPDMRAKMREEVHTILKRVGITAILVTHDHDEAFAIADKVAVLHAGRLEQIDTPETIYHLPQTPFVADFVGSADFIPAEAKSDGLIHTEVGRFPNRMGYPIGNAIVVMVRPDDLKIIPDSHGTARVVSKQFRGSENLYAVSLPSGQIVHSSEHALSVYPIGSRVTIELVATHTVVFRQDSVKNKASRLTNPITPSAL